MSAPESWSLRGSVGHSQRRLPQRPPEGVQVDRRRHRHIDKRRRQPLGREQRRVRVGRVVGEQTPDLLALALALALHQEPPPLPLVPEQLAQPDLAQLRGPHTGEASP